MGINNQGGGSQTAVGSSTRLLEVSWPRPPGWMSCRRPGHWGGVAKAGSRKADFLHVAGSWRAPPAQATAGRPSCQILWNVPTQTAEDSVAFLVSETLSLWTFFFFSICISSFSIQQFLSYILEVLIFNVTVPFIGKISGLSIFVPCGGLWPRIGAYEVPNERKHLVIHEHLVGDYFSILDPVSQPVWPRNVGRASFSEVRTEGIPAWRLGRSLRGRDTSGEPVSRGLAICDSAFLFCTLAYREARHVEISVLQWIFF